jgi:hypothetical protein
MEQTKATLETAQQAPEEQRMALLQGITGENITGDLLTATIWGYYASLQNQAVIGASQAETIDLPGLSFGLFHAQVSVKQLYGLITTGVVFEGLNLDMGHLRNIRWVKDDNPGSAINDPQLMQHGRSAAQNRLIAYNRQAGQYMSLMEAVVPEQFWTDKSQCRYQDENGQLQNPTLPDCAQGISAVKAIAIAQQQGQKSIPSRRRTPVQRFLNYPLAAALGRRSGMPYCRARK